MAKREKTENQPKRRSHVGIILLILLLLLVPCGVILLYTFSVAAVSCYAAVWALAVLATFSVLAEKELKK